MNANRKDADLWMRVWEKVNGHQEQGFRLRLAWVKDHTTAKEKAQMTQQNKQTALANDEADELAKDGAS